MKPKKRSIQIRKRMIPVLVGAVLLLVLVIVAYRLARSWEYSRSQVSVPTDSVIFPENERAILQVGDQQYALKDGLEIVLLLGVDKFQTKSETIDTYRNDQQADFLSVLILDHEAKTCTPLELNRDTMAEIPILGVGGKEAGSAHAQLALAHTYGNGKEQSCENTVEAVSQFLYGMEIDHYVALSMEAVPVLNDAVGGVTVEIKDDFSKVDPALVTGEEIRLQGEQALTFVRARGKMEDSSNLNRMGRQREYLIGLYEQLKKSLEIDASLPARLLADLSTSMVSDYSIEEWIELLDSIRDYKMEDIQVIVGEAVKGEEHMEFYADEKALQKQLIDLQYELVIE